MKEEYDSRILHRCQFNFSIYPDGEIYCQAPAYIRVWGKIIGAERKRTPYEEGFWLCQEHFDLLRVRENFNLRYKDAEEN